MKVGSEKLMRVLLGLPVVLLPLANVLAAVLTHTSLAALYTEQSALISFLPSGIMFIIGAVIEELFFRFFLLKKVLLSTNLKSWISILIVSVFFAGMHLFNLQSGAGLTSVMQQMGCAFAFSIWAGAVTWRKTWLIPLLAHVLLNATAGGEVIWMEVLVSVVVLLDGIFLMKGKKSEYTELHAR